MIPKTLVPLPDVVFFQEGPGLRKWQWTDHGMKVINVTNILGDSAGSVDVSNTDKYISLLEFEQKYKHFAVENGDFVVASSGNTYGKVGKVTESCLPLMMNTSVIRFHSLDPERLDNDYLYAFLRSPDFRNQVERFVIGGAQPNFGPSHLKKMVIPVRSLREQRRIASVISGYDDLIENNRRRIQLLEQFARLLYKEWFAHLRFPGHEHVKIKDGVPEGWQRSCVPDVIDINPITKAERGTEITYVPMASLSEIGMTADAKLFERRATHTSVRFQRNDVLFARITPCLENGKTAFVDFLKSGEVACGSTEFIVLRGRLVSPYFVYCLSRSYKFRELAIKSMTGSSGRQRVQESSFSEYLVPVPPPFIADSFDQFAKPCFRQIETLVNENNKLAKARDFLLPRLMSGELTI